MPPTGGHCIGSTSSSKSFRLRRQNINRPARITNPAPPAATPMAIGTVLELGLWTTPDADAEAAEAEVAEGAVASGTV